MRERIFLFASCTSQHKRRRSAGRFCRVRRRYIKEKRTEREFMVREVVGGSAKEYSTSRLRYTNIMPGHNGRRSFENDCYTRLESNNRDNWAKDDGYLTEAHVMEMRRDIVTPTPRRK